MKNSFGGNITVTVFGESRGAAVGCVIDGLAPGIPVDTASIGRYLSLRRPYGEISTARREKDEYVIESGVYNGYTSGTPLCIVIPNADAAPAEDAAAARPSHADYTGFVKYKGFNDPRGGGHFSGRVTAAIVAAGAVVMPYLNAKGVFIGTHIKSIAGVADRDFRDYKRDIEDLIGKNFAVLDDTAGEEMRNAILAAKSEGDSVGGVLETAVIGLPAGLGDPFFDTVEGLLAHAMFAIPGVKGVEFGAGFGISGLKGSESNDGMRYENGRIVTSTNNSGGINGGVTNGMPLIMRCAVRPTPTISKAQETVDFIEKKNTVITSSGRQDPCIVHRVRAVADCMTALVAADLLSGGAG